ncbi:MAG: GNAT family N-acetyltransferase [Lentisphaeria bacterium]|nr:GNAT family N-acetyltransferase [Lentisphaeria bacterium]
MDILQEKQLVSGDILRIIHWNASEKAPRKYADYIAASMGSDHPHNNLYNLNGWRAYFNDAMNGLYFPEIIDHWFIAEINGECAARVWFAYSNKSYRGNFGNVLTEPQFRKQGLMNELMHYCMEEIYRSPVRMLCCATGNRFAAATYIKSGFNLIYGGETGPLCFLKNGDFLSEAKQVYSGRKITEVRPGRISDQFDCDKFLAYTPEIYHRKLSFRTGPAAQVEDFRLAFQETLSSRAVVCTALNEKKECCGYAFALLMHGMPVLDFTVHPAYLEDAPELIRKTADSFKEKSGVMPLYYGNADDTEKNKVLQQAGMRNIAGKIHDGIICQGKTAELLVLQF